MKTTRTTNAKLVNDTIQRFKKEKSLKEITADGLKVLNPKTPKFYMQPIIHVSCHTLSISKYVDYHLQPIVKDIPSYVQDTTDFLTKKSLLVTLDVKCLYNNILNNEGINAVREAYDKHSSKTVSTKVMITFLSLTLTLNNFIFNSSHYLQVMGSAVGTICGPTYANTFMAQFQANIYILRFMAKPFYF